MQDRNLVVGIDIGEMKTPFGFVDREGTIYNATSMPTQADEAAQTFVSRLHRRIEEIRVSLPSSHRLCGIGIGAPNAHHDLGTIEKTVNLNWGDTVDFVTLIRKYYELHISITNDDHAASVRDILLVPSGRYMSEFLSDHQHGRNPYEELS
jgi:predicted NBD/HSP70 family sugar kinase